jgi:hypothetical protein
MNLQSRIVLGGFLLLSPLASSIPAHAVICMNGGYSASALSAAGFSCTLGDKTFSQFSFTGFKPGATFGFDEPALGFHTFNGQSLGFGPGSNASYSYKIQVVSGAPAYIIKYQTSTSQLGSPRSLTKTLRDTSTPGGIVSVPATGGTSSEYSYSLPGVKGPLTMAGTLTVTSGTLTQFVDSYEQEPKIPPVPGPLPLLGAGAAFGFTRKLRKRISASV